MKQNLGIYRSFVAIVVSMFVFGPIILFAFESLEGLDFAEYRALFERTELSKTFAQSVVVAAASVAFSCLIGVPAAYFASRVEGAKSTVLYLTALSLWLAPPVALSIQVYQWYRSFHLYDSLAGMILLYGVLGAALTVVVVKPFFDQLPSRIDELAWQDGYNGVETLRQIIAPRIGMIVAGTAALVFTQSWNELLFASLLTDQKVSLLPVRILGLTTGNRLYWGQISAASVIAIAPALIVIAGLLIHQMKTSKKT
ncbi:MAG: ABC transporter permease subunit [Verrucomicrobiales bacterium]|nr:ABC transporter permease subunit [Verrucomicrobiales bacterium]